MKMSSLKAVMMVLVAVGVAASAMAEPSVTVSSMVKTGYITSSGLVLSRDAVIQSDVFTAFGNGVWMDLWNSEGLSSGPDSGADDEIDIGAGWAGKLGQSGLFADVGVYDFNLYHISRFDDGDIIQAYVELTQSTATTVQTDPYVQTCAGYVRVETYRDTGNGSVADFDSMYFTGIKHTMTFSDRMMMKDKWAVGYDPGLFGAEPGLLAFYEGQLNLQVTKALTVTPLWMKYVGLFDGDINVVVGAGASMTF
jgi:hypothetical protein